MSGGDASGRKHGDFYKVYIHSPRPEEQLLSCLCPTITPLRGCSPLPLVSSFCVLPSPRLASSCAPWPWQVLGVPRGAGDAQIKNAYRKLAIQHHPDKTSGVCLVLSATVKKGTHAAQALQARCDHARLYIPSSVCACLQGIQRWRKSSRRSLQLTPSCQVRHSLQRAMIHNERATFAHRVHNDW